MKNNSLLLIAIFMGVVQAFSQTPCVNGMAGIYPCDNIDLLSSVSINSLGGSQNLNDVWGWTDEESGREFALVGLNNRTSFVEITDPLTPVILGYITTATNNSLWRDVKVYDNHAFIVSEAGGHGMQIFDLELLLGDLGEGPVEFEATAHYDGFGSAHNIVINEESGFAYGVGANSFFGGLHIIDISDPINPVIAGGFGGDGYTHDAQVVNYDGPDEDYIGKEIAFCGNEDAVTIVDVSDKTNTELISTLGYELSAYTHQGWLTDDKSFFIFNDEIDENVGLVETTRTLIMDVRDLDNPVLFYEYFSTSTAIDHNLYTNGSLCYQSNYRSGLRILDVGNVYEQEISQLGFFDSQPSDDDQSYSGNWSNYVYFPSGTVIMSDMFTSLFILRPTLINAYRYAEVCPNAEQVEFYVDITSAETITSAFSSDFLPNDMTVTIGEIEAPGRIPVTVNFLAEINLGEYSIPITLYNEEELVFNEMLKIAVTSGVEQEFSGLLPADGFDSGMAPITFQWDAIENLTSYTLVVSETADFSEIILEEQVEGTTFEETFSGTYYWKIVAPSSCGVLIDSEVNSFTSNSVGIEELASSIKFYPNPAQAELYVEGISGNAAIYSVDGKLIKQITVTESEAVDVRDLSNGVYVIKFSDNKGQLSFIKE